METLVLNSKSKKDVVLLIDIAKRIGLDLKIVPQKKGTNKLLTSKEVAFYKKFEVAVKQSKEIASGKSKGKLLSDTLDEI